MDRVRLHFLPPYAPNLNAIERLRGEMHRCVTHNKHYPSEMEFVQATHGFFTVTLPKHWKSIHDAVSDNFRVVRLRWH
jgi:transposase